MLFLLAAGGAALYLKTKSQKSAPWQKARQSLRAPPRSSSETYSAPSASAGTVQAENVRRGDGSPASRQPQRPLSDLFTASVLVQAAPVRLPPSSSSSSSSSGFLRRFCRLHRQLQPAPAAPASGRRAAPRIASAICPGRPRRRLRPAARATGSSSVTSTNLGSTGMPCATFRAGLRGAVVRRRFHVRAGQVRRRGSHVKDGRHRGRVRPPVPVESAGRLQGIGGPA